MDLKELIDVSGEIVTERNSVATIVGNNTKHYRSFYNATDIYFQVEIKDNKPIYVVTYMKKDEFKKERDTTMDGYNEWLKHSRMMRGPRDGC